MKLKNYIASLSKLAKAFQKQQINIFGLEKTTNWNIEKVGASANIQDLPSLKMTDNHLNYKN